MALILNGCFHDHSNEQMYHEMLEAANELLGMEPQPVNEMDGMDTIARALWKMMDPSTQARMANIYRVDEERLLLMLEWYTVDVEGSMFNLMDPGGYVYAFAWEDGRVHLWHGPY